MDIFITAAESGVDGEENSIATRLLDSIHADCAANAWTRQRLFWTCAIHLALHEFDPPSVLWHLAQRILRDLEEMESRHSSDPGPTENIFDGEALILPDHLPYALGGPLPKGATRSRAHHAGGTHVEYSKSKFIRLAKIIQVILHLLKTQICDMARLVQSPEWRHDHLPRLYHALISRGQAACSAAILRRWTALVERLESDARLDELRASRSHCTDSSGFLRSSMDTVRHRPIENTSSSSLAQVATPPHKLFTRPSSLLLNAETTMDAEDAAAVLLLKDQQHQQQQQLQDAPKANPAKILWKLFRGLWDRPDLLCPRVRAAEFIGTPFDIENVILPVDYSLQKTRLYTRILQRVEMDAVLRSLKTLGQTWREFLGAEAPSDIPIQRAPLIFPRINAPPVFTRMNHADPSRGGNAVSWEDQCKSAIVSSTSIDPRVVLQSLPACVTHMINSATELKNDQRVFLASFIATAFSASAFPTAESVLRYLQTHLPESDRPSKQTERLKGIDGWLANKRRGKPFVENCGNIINGMVQMPDFPITCPFASEHVETLRTTGQVVDIEDLATSACKNRLGIATPAKKTPARASGTGTNPVQAWVKSRNVHLEQAPM